MVILEVKANFLKGIDNKVGILVIEQETQVNRNGNSQNRFRVRKAPFPKIRKSQTGDIIDTDGKQHQHDQNSLTPGIETQTGQQQEEITVFLLEQEIKDQDQR